MATPINYPLINGVRHSFSSITLKLNGNEFVGFKSITYTRERERTMVYGAHPDPLGKTRGKNSYKAEIEVYAAEWNVFVLQELGPGYGDVVVPVFVTYTESGFDTQTDHIQGGTIDTSEGGGSEGTDALTRKFNLNPVKILYNGIDDCEIPLAQVGAVG